MADERNFEERPYTEDEERVARFLSDDVGLGGGDDPIGFVIASHAELARQKNLLASRLRDAGLSDDVWGDGPDVPGPRA